MKEIIEELYKEDGKFHHNALKRGRENEEEFKNALLKELKRCINSSSLRKEPIPLFADYAVFLLAEFRDKRAFPLILELITLPLGDPFDYLGIGIMDNIPSLLASTYDGNIEIANQIIENPLIDDYTKCFVIKLYQYLYESALISKDELIAYFRKIIAFITKEKDNTELVADSILSIIIDCHIFEMIKDVEDMFDEQLINPRIRGGYIEFIDALFNYANDEKIKLITKAEDYMLNWACFDDNNRQDISDVNTSKMLENYLEKETKDYDYSKVGRNDPCPCGSGKKFKKCCIDKIKDMLPYQKYIDYSLAEYPKKNDTSGQVDFYTYYKQEYITIDALIYKGVKNKTIPIFIERDKAKELTIEFNYLNQAWELIKDVIAKNHFKTLEEYDDEVSIHCSLITFFDKYCYCVLKLNQIKNHSLKELEDIIRYFYENFEITKIYSHTFLECLNNYFTVTRKYQKGIDIFESWLTNDNYCKICLCSYLFHLYGAVYDYDKTIEKMDKIIEEIKDEDIKEILIELKEDFEDDNKSF